MKHINFYKVYNFIHLIKVYNFNIFNHKINKNLIFSEYPSENNQTHLDVVYILQNDEEMFKTGIFEDKNKIIKCNDKSLQFHKMKSEKYVGHFWGYNNITSKAVKCVIFHGMISNLKQNLKPNIYR